MRYRALVLLSFAACGFDPATLSGTANPDTGAAPDGEPSDPPGDPVLPDAAPGLPADAPFPDLPPNDCPEGWTRPPSLSSCYRLTSEAMSWTEARDDCADQGAHLAIVDEQPENDYARALLSNGNLWIGLNDLDTEGAFVWVNGKPPIFTHWGVGEPNDGSLFEAEDCTHLRNDGFWNDENCASEYRGVCELEP